MHEEGTGCGLPQACVAFLLFPFLTPYVRFELIFVVYLYLVYVASL